MAGRGPAPKPASQRRNRSKPQRGDWIDLPDLEEPLLPPLPLGEWSERTQSAWEAWRSDPATSQYGPAEISNAIDLAYVFEQWVQGDARLAAEIRLRQDGLGLTPKGKRDLRWRTPEEAVAEVEQARAEATAVDTVKPTAD